MCLDLHVKRSSTPLLSFDTPLKPSSSPLVNTSITKPATPPFELQPSSLPAVRNINMQQPQSQLSQHPKQQQKPKPLINFQNKSAMQYDSMATNDNNTRDSYFNDAADNQPIITVARPSPITIDNHITQQQSTQNTPILEGRKSIILPPSPPTVNTLSDMKTSPLPTSTITVNTNTNNTAVPVTNGSRTLMERMKERHRQEVRRSLNGSPFLENQTVARKNLSSPSMPTLYSAAALNDPSSLIQNHNVAATGTGSIMSSSPVQRTAARPLVQSHSLSYIKPIANIKRQPNHLVRSTSAMIDMHSTGLLGSRPIQVWYIIAKKDVQTLIFFSFCRLNLILVCMQDILHQVVPLNSLLQRQEGPLFKQDQIMVLPHFLIKYRTKMKSVTLCNTHSIDLFLPTQAFLNKLSNNSNNNFNISNN